ncbi:hypothetical protein [Alishewanella tabrizica]|uniref:Uncharacterized protein n=1 Tax=Alishewanella tabrizica TaxID=671278 RepID=A0ABQ2WIK2_9ALTE|nr:hypothetical protein [Alishewanella tabrizica]GGW57257.1 hypothetical protein GCM10008111_11660 [Alishewanella tabrizica]
MMNSILLVHGYPIINMPAKHEQEFNTLMLNFYMAAMNKFLQSCIDKRIIRNFKLDLLIG